MLGLRKTNLKKQIGLEKDKYGLGPKAGKGDKTMLEKELNQTRGILISDKDKMCPQPNKTFLLQKRRRNLSGGNGAHLETQP